MRQMGCAPERECLPNGLLQKCAIALMRDFSSTSILALYRSVFSSHRRYAAFFLSTVGPYVSGIRHKSTNLLCQRPFNSKEETYLNTNPDDDDVERPSPGCILINEPANQRTESRTEEGSESVNTHGPRDLRFRPHIGY